ncbi:MAG TPA: hypothetical protein VIN59_04720 [Alphaproteobacteria bacterium]
MLSVQTASFEAFEGAISIAFDDVAYARAETVYVDTNSNEISALVDGVHIALGAVSPEIAAHLAGQGTIALRGPHPLGHELILIAALQTTH